MKIKEVALWLRAAALEAHEIPAPVLTRSVNMDE